MRMTPWRTPYRITGRISADDPSPRRHDDLPIGSKGQAHPDVLIQTSIYRGC
jgi:hypothetical protein